MAGSFTTEMDSILLGLLGKEIHQQVLAGVNLSSETLQSSLAQVVKRHGTLLSARQQKKLLLLGELASRLKVPSDMCREVMMESKALDVQDVVTQFWTAWYRNPQRKGFAVSLFEAQPTKVIAALVLGDHFNLPQTLKLDVSNVLMDLGPTFDLLRKPLRADDKAILKLDSLNDPARKRDVLMFLSSLQQLSRIVIEPLDLPVLMGLGYSSSHQIAYSPLHFFQTIMSKHGISREQSARIHKEANAVQLVAEQTWMKSLQAAQDLGAPVFIPSNKAAATLATQGEPETLSLGTSRGGNNLSAWFGDLDEVGCADCCSVTSPAAYFVDLLRFLKCQPASMQFKNINVTEKGFVSLLQKLLARRPDLGHLLLSCRNTSELVPYIDLVNETLESAAAFLNGKDRIGEQGLPLQAYNADDWDVHTRTGSTAPQDAVNVRYDVYDDLVAKMVYPTKTFPYDHSKDSLRQYLNAAGTDMAEILRTFRSDHRLSPAAPSSPLDHLGKDTDALETVRSRAIAAETLSMSQADLVAITLESCYDLDAARLVQQSDSLSREDYLTLCGLLPSWQYWGYQDTEDVHDDAGKLISEATFGEDTILDATNGDGLTFIKKQLLPRLGVDFATLFKILKTRFLGGCLTVSPLPGGSKFEPMKSIPSQLQGFRLRAKGGEHLDVESLQRLDQFSRLWRRLGWDVEDVDDAVWILGGRDTTVDDRTIITPEAVQQLAAVAQLAKESGVPAGQILSIFGVSARHLLNLPIAQALSVQDKLNPGVAAKTSQYLPLLLSSLDLSYDDFVHVQSSQELGDELTMATLLIYHRTAQTAKIMGVAAVQVTELLAAIWTTERRNGPPIPLSDPKTFLNTFQAWKRFQANGWSVEDLLLAAKFRPDAPESGLDRDEQSPAPLPATLECAGKLLSAVNSVREILTSGTSGSQDTSSKTNTSSLPESVQTSSSHAVVQSTLQGRFPQLAPETLTRLLHSPSLSLSQAEEPLYKKVMTVTHGDLVDPCQVNFRGGMFLSTETEIRVEVTTSQGIQPAPTSLVFGGHEYPLVRREEAGDSGTAKLQCTVKGLATDTFIAFSWPPALSEIKMSFLIPDMVPQTDAPAPHILTEDALLQLQGVLSVLQQYSLVLQRSPMEVEELETVESLTGKVPSTLALARSFQQYTTARRAMAKPKKAKEFAGLLRWLQQTPASTAAGTDSVVDIAKRFGECTTLKQSTVEKLLRCNFPGKQMEEQKQARFTQSQLCQLDVMERLGRQVVLLNRTGLKEDSIELLFAIADPPQLQSPTRRDKTQAAARPESQLVHLMRAALVNKGLKRSLETAQNTLRDNRRKALIQFLLQQPSLRALDVFDEDALFEYFLIDVQMGTGLDTTRIKQAISTIHLFVHRCLLGLEKGVDGTLIPQDRWSWMQKYTLWEANRKVFLYPENWADPTLRDSKTALFVSIEEAIAQTNLDDKAISKAIRSFVYGADEVANLRVEAFFWDRAVTEDNLVDSNGKATEANGEGSFHFIARSRNAPYQYYYRRLEYLSRNNPQPVTSFTAWEKLPFDIRSHDVDHDGKPLPRPGTYIVPVVWRNRLIIFLPQLSVKTNKTGSGKATATNISMTSTAAPKAGEKVTQEMRIDAPSSANLQLNLEIKMAWSEYVDGVWSAQKQSQDAIIVQGATNAQPPGFDSFRFTAKSSDDRVTVIVYQNTGVSESSAKNICLGEFSLQGPKLSFRTRTAMSTTPRLENQQLPETRFGVLEKPSLTNTSIKDATKKPTNISTDNAAWPALSAPPLDKGRTSTAIAWIMDSNDTKSRQLGLLADLVTSDKQGQEPWFTIPEQLVKRSGAAETADTVWSFPFFNPLNDELRDSVTADDGVEAIYQVMDRASVTDASGTKGVSHDFAFGWSNFLTQCREDASPAAIYNWELGFHLVSLIVERLISQQEFDRAVNYAHLVFDPTGTNDPPPTKDPWRPTWRFPPFRDSSTRAKGTIDSVLDNLNPSSGSEAAMAYTIKAWRQNPFKPHTVARGRPLAYMKRFVIKYIEALIASGDTYFRQNSLESLPLAIQRYVEAGHVFGPAPQKVPELGKKRFKSYHDIEAQIDDFSNASVELQLLFPYYIPLAERGLSKADPGGNNLQGFPRSRYFGVQSNQAFSDLRALIDDRLFKIRNSLDINGNLRTLSLWDPPLNVGDLVNAAAAASATKTDMALIISGFPSALPRTRFLYLIQKALELCAELKGTSSLLLSAMEKRDAESLVLLRSSHDTGMQRILKEMKLLQKAEAERGLEQLFETRKSALHRLAFFSAVTGDKVSAPQVGSDQPEFEPVEQNISPPTDEDLRLTLHEVLELAYMDKSSMYNTLAANDDAWAAIFFAVPMPAIMAQPMGVGVSEQLPNLGQAWQAEAAQRRSHALKASEEGQRVARIAQWTRQLQDRRLQLNLAGLEIQAINKQIQVQQARIATIDKDVAAQDQAVANAQEVQAFLSTKFTNVELYAWLENSARAYLYQVYLVTMELARKVEATYHFELGPGKRPILSSSGYWDQGKRGLQCGDRLWLALKQMEMAYLNERPAHAFEISKNVSLRQLDAAALLSLRETGDSGVFELPELIFDLDFPGHYFRRIQSVAVSVHAITGPHTNINCTATLVEHKYRFSPSTTEGYSSKGDRDPRFVGQDSIVLPITSIAVSHGQQDPGVFELNFNGDSYQPFEGAGAISKWRLKLPPRQFRQFDYRTISDVVLQVRYTAKDGGALLYEAAAKVVEEQMRGLKARELPPVMVDVKNDCSDAWFGFSRSEVTKEGTRVLAMRNVKERFPFFTKGMGVTIKSVKGYVRKTPGGATGGRKPEEDMAEWKLHVSKTREVDTTAAGAGGAVTLGYTEILGDDLGVFAAPQTPGGQQFGVVVQSDAPWYLIVEGSSGTGTGQGAWAVPQDIFLLVEYKLT
ncbi:hypothetical protein QBC43DRAFT_357472 [Cladorrhinum sp. PSN259]|nr:hypothetical protein QBC43DRAFT_357472 [Cladorrhinum sp. PSN259]